MISERIRELQSDGSIVITLSPRYDTGLHFEKRLLTTGNVLDGRVEYEHYLYAGGLMFGKYVTINNAAGALTSSKVEYYHKDHLGSIVAITDEAGVIALDAQSQPKRYAYDVWGKRRNPNGAANPPINVDMYHGYTGHEMLDDLGLIHMNGRLYDPVTGRFISADFLIQTPRNLQSYNRYTYGWNNPLSGTDPSGQNWFEDKLRHVSWANFRDDVLKPVVIVTAVVATGGTISGSAWATCTSAGATWGGVAAGATSGAVGGMLGAAMYGGTPDQIMSAAFRGAVTGAIFSGLNEISRSGGWGNPTRIAANSFAGGAMSWAQGGDFVTGMRNMFITQTSAWGYEELVGYSATPESGGSAEDKTEYSLPKKGNNNIGTAGPVENGSLWGEGGYVSRSLNFIPGVNSVAGAHDMFQIILGKTGGALARNVFNVPGMIPAAGITYLAMQPPSLVVELSVKQRRYGDAN